jgi:excisionase family DNA binding protein
LGTFKDGKMSEFWTVKQVAEWLNVSTAKVYLMVDQRSIPCFRIDGTIRFRKKELQEWLEKKRLQEIKDSDEKN